MKSCCLVMMFVLTRLLTTNSQDVCKDGTMSPDPSSCHRYLICHQSGKLTSMPCPVGTKFDSTLNICNFDHLVTCSNQTNVKIVPSKPQGLTVKAINSTTLQLNWLLPSNYSKPLTSFIILVKQIGSKVWQQYTVDSSLLLSIISGVTPGSKYFIKVKAKNSVGISQPASAVITTPLNVSPPPILVLAKGLGTTAIMLRWKNPTLDNDYILNYIVTYGKVKNGSSRMTLRFRGYSKTAVITNLDKDTEYEINVQAQTFGGIGAPATARVKTWSGIRSLVTNPTTRSILNLCPQGYHSKTGTKPCLPCMYGYYQEMMGMTKCIKCLQGKTTLVQGAKSKTQCNNVNAS